MYIFSKYFPCVDIQYAPGHKFDLTITIAKLSNTLEELRSVQVGTTSSEVSSERGVSRGGPVSGSTLSVFGFSVSSSSSPSSSSNSSSCTSGTGFGFHQVVRPEK